MSKRKIYISRYKIPITRDGDEIQEIPVTRDQMEFQDKEEIDAENLSLKLQEYTQKVKAFNMAQVRIAKSNTRDYMYKKIITKD